MQAAIFLKQQYHFSELRASLPQMLRAELAVFSHMQVDSYKCILAEQINSAFFNQHQTAWKGVIVKCHFDSCCCLQIPLVTLYFKASRDTVFNSVWNPAVKGFFAKTIGAKDHLSKIAFVGARKHNYLRWIMCFLFSQTLACNVFKYRNYSFFHIGKFVRLGC